MTLFVWQRTVTDRRGDVLSGAWIEVKDQQSGSLIALYEDAAGNESLENPFRADSEGFARFYANNGPCRIRAYVEGQERIWENEVIGPTTKRTQAEIDAGVTPTDYSYPPGDIRRYGTNTTPGTTDMTAAITAATSTGLLILQSETYKFSQLDLPANLVIRARGATLRYDGSTSSGTVPLRLGANTRFDEIYMTTPGTEANTSLIRVGAGTQGDVLRLEADVQHAGTGSGILLVDPQDTKIGRVKAVNIDRPVHLWNTSEEEQTTGAWIGFLEAENYVRAFRATFCSFELGSMFVRGRSANASKSPGHNGILIVGCKNWKTGNLWIEDAAEHAIRIGGSEGPWAVTEDFQVGDVFAVRPGGCPLKINPTRLAEEPNVTEVCSRFRFGNIIGIDVGEGADVVQNEELLRLTHVRDGYIESAMAYCDQYEHSAYYGLKVNDTDGLYIGTLGGENFTSSFIVVYGLSDDNETTSFGSHIKNVYIGKLIGTCSATNAIYIEGTTFEVGPFVIADMEISGFGTNLVTWVDGTAVGPIEIRGRVYGSVSPLLNNIPTLEDFQVDIRYSSRRYMGRADSMRISAQAGLQVTHGAFDPTDEDPRGIFANASAVSSGVLGGAIELSRVGSTRRAAAIVAEKTGDDANENGLTFYFGSDVASSDALIRLFKVLHTGSFYIPYEPVYADNAAALAGGLTAGMTYHTSTGERRVVV